MEIWKPIVGYEGLYEISTLGRVKSFHKGKWGIGKPYIIKSSRIGKIYSIIGLYKDGVRNRLTIHRLVAQHFIPNPLNLPYVLHKVEDLDEKGFLYNGEDNLFWGTQKDNMIDRSKKGRSNNHLQLNHPSKGKFGKDSIFSKKINQYSLKSEFIKEWGSIIDASKELGLYSQNISSCCKGKIKHSGGFIWRYQETAVTI